MGDITRLKTDMQMLSVRIMDSQNKHCGSGLLYIHDEKNVFVLTAAHVLGEFGEGQKFFVKCHPDPSPGNDESEEEDKYIFSISRTEDNVQPAYIPGAFPKNKYNVQDAAVIKLDISGKEDWILKRKRARFAPENHCLEHKKIFGSGYPKGRGANSNQHMALEPIDPEKATCWRHNLRFAKDDSKHAAEWKFEINISDPYDDEEINGWSGCILAMAETNEITLAGVTLAIYPGYKHQVFRGADMYFIRKLLEGKWVKKVNEAAPTVNTGKLTEPPQIDPQEPVANAPAMPPVSDFNLRCVRNMLEGKSWVHMLQANADYREVELRPDIGKRMSMVTFTSDADFLEKIIPKDILEALCFDASNDSSIKEIMEGRYSDEIRVKVISRLAGSDQKTINPIITFCANTMKWPGWERCFVASYQLFFELMGARARAFRYDMQVCKAHDNMAKGMAMLIVYALLGSDWYAMFMQILNKRIEEIWG